MDKKENIKTKSQGKWFKDKSTKIAFWTGLISTTLSLLNFLTTFYN